MGPPFCAFYGVVHEIFWIWLPSDQNRKNVNAVVAGSPPVVVIANVSPPFIVVPPPRSFHVIVYVALPTGTLVALPAAASAVAVPAVVPT